MATVASDATGYSPPVARRARRKAATEANPTAAPTIAPIASSSTMRMVRSVMPYPGLSIHSMNPMTSTTATGSFVPDSPSSIRARRRLSVDPRSSEKIAALSVAATMEPMSMPSSRSRSKIHAAANPVRIAVRIVPRVDRLIAVPSTGRISEMPAERPPSNRIRASAMTPSVRASS